jgi:hypothetical protein
MYNRTQPFELPFVPYKNFNFDKSTTPFTLKKGFDLPITSKGFVKSVKTPTVID